MTTTTTTDITTGVDEGGDDVGDGEVSGGASCTTPQICFGHNSDEVAPSPVFLSPGLYAFPVKHGETLAITGIEIYTGLTTAPSSLVLAEDADGRPGSSLVSIPFDMTSDVAWQGTKLAEPLVSSGANRVWIIWANPEGSQANIAGSGEVGEALYLPDGADDWEVRDHPWMYRLLCCP